MLKEIWYVKFWCLGGKGVGIMVLSKSFCLAWPENFARRPFCVADFIWYGKRFMDQREGGGYHDFLSKTLCLTVPEKFAGEPTNVSGNIGIEKFYAQEGDITFLRWNSLPHSVEKICWVPFCVSKNTVSKIFMRRKSMGGIAVLWKKVTSHRTETRKILRELSCLPKNIWYR